MTPACLPCWPYCWVPSLVSPQYNPNKKREQEGAGQQLATSAPCGPSVSCGSPTLSFPPLLVSSQTDKPLKNSTSMSVACSPSFTPGPKMLASLHRLGDSRN